MTNRVRHYRKEAGYTQRQLAELAETSQQQIQRIEAGVSTARLDLALRICTALQIPLDALFPGTSKLLEKAKAERKKTRSLPQDSWTQLRASGVEADPRTWFFKVLLRGHHQEHILPISASDKERLFDLLQYERSMDDSVPFVVFDSEDYRIAINVRELIYCHFLFEVEPETTGIRDELETLEVQVYFSNDTMPRNFGVDRDEGEPEDEDDEGRFRGIFFDLELDVSQGDRILFEDQDGEYVFLRAGDIAMLRAPLEVMYPSHWSESEFSTEEDKE